ncbi:hypothetical protein [Candidatus Frankia nodulisporulans]|uniref:hypothetical protein n=1 Tax=Candidatus Frankia nodulisporulans TaxID=2060052 RepID=UPI0013D40899|nr:hypothetical protein [Candidatus Frankia nodulisporulans]
MGLPAAPGGPRRAGHCGGSGPGTHRHPRCPQVADGLRHRGHRQLGAGEEGPHRQRHAQLVAQPGDQLHGQQ